MRPEEEVGGLNDEDVAVPRSAVAGRTSQGIGSRDEVRTLYPGFLACPFLVS